jgi:hypothetical protein
MPCQYCRNPSHRISSCESSVERWIGPINEMWVSRRCDILGQLVFLSTYSKVKLLMVGRSLGMSLSSGSKEGIITRLVENRIVSQVVAQVGNLSLAEQASINNSYEMLLGSNVMGSRTLVQILIDALEMYYVAWLGRRRTGMTIAQLMYLVENPGEFLPEEYYAEEEHNNVADIAVNPAMQVEVECGVCYEFKSRVKFNCSHEFCKDCVHLMCAHKGENPIKCPMCRGSVTSFEVEDEVSREALLVVA